MSSHFLNSPWSCSLKGCEQHTPYTPWWWYPELLPSASFLRPHTVPAPSHCWERSDSGEPSCRKVSPSGCQSTPGTVHGQSSLRASLLLSSPLLCHFNLIRGPSPQHHWNCSWKCCQGPLDEPGCPRLLSLGLFYFFYLRYPPIDKLWLSSILFARGTFSWHQSQHMPPTSSPPWLNIPFMATVFHILIPSEYFIVLIFCTLVSSFYAINSFR